MLIGIWRGIFSGRRDSRWVRINAIGSSYARPELMQALFCAQDEFLTAVAAALGPAAESGWLRPGLDIRNAVAWQHGLLLSRVFLEHGSTAADLDEWDDMSLRHLVAEFFGG